MVFGVANQSLPGRGPTPGLRFFAYAVLAIVLMFLDRREGWMEQVRFGLQTATYPLQLAVSSPAAAWSWLRESTRTRETLREENTTLRTRLRDLELRTMRYEALAQENAKLRNLSGALPPVAEKWLIAEIVHVELGGTGQQPRVLINRGTTNGVYKGQAVMDDDGIIGQTTHVGPWSAEVILITDADHDIPVQIERTGVRTIAQGIGNKQGVLGLPYLPANADIKVGDLLLTSGLGGVFPQGYPVARVTELHREALRPQDQVRAEPLAHINSTREVMLVWFRDAHPAAPVRATQEDLPKGDPNAKPQPAPPKPKPAAPAAEAGGAAPSTKTTTPPRQTSAAPGTSSTTPRPTPGAPGASSTTPRQTAPASGTAPAPARQTPPPPAAPPATDAPRAPTQSQPATPPAGNRE